MADPEPPPEPLQFDIAQPAAGGEASPPSCAFCSRAIEQEYFTLSGRISCGACRAAVQAELGGPPKPARFLKALGLGAAAAALGCMIYYVVRAVTNYEIGLVAILVGYLVGAGVRRGSGGRGGWLYQGLAVALTYLAVVLTYVPAILEAVRNMPPPGAAAAESPSPGGVAGAPAPPTVVEKDVAPRPALPPPAVLEVVIGIAFLVLIACAAPFLGGAGNLIGLLIIGFALFQAWSLNRRLLLTFSGPFKAGRKEAGGA